MGKPRIFINMTYMELGGAERALLGLLNAIDTERVDVDLFINQHTGAFMKLIPAKINLLPENKMYSLIRKPIAQLIRNGRIRLALSRLWALNCLTIYQLTRVLCIHNCRLSKVILWTSLILDTFERFRPQIVINLAAQAGVRYSLENPDNYVQSNVVGFLNLLESARKYPVHHFIFASSSSVYGLNGKLPYSTHDSVSHPVSLYAATKIADEMMAHTYSHLFKIPCTGLRFFTVYGPWGRPDMSPYLFADAISNDKPLKVYNYGKMRRDFTYIDDIVEGIIKVVKHPPTSDPSWDNKEADCATSSAPYAIYNIGNTHSVNLIDYISAFEIAFCKEANNEFLPLQPGDVLETFSDMEDMKRDFDFTPKVNVTDGVKRYVEWFRNYYGK